MKIMALGWFCFNGTNVVDADDYEDNDDNDDDDKNNHDDVIDSIKYKCCNNHSKSVYIV